MKVGFVGLGNMGSAIAGHLIAAGHELTVWNRSPEKAEPLVAKGARRAATPAEAAAGEVVVTMLLDDAAVEAVTFGADGIHGAPSAPIHVSMSTISVALARRLAEASPGRFVSAPVFGRPDAAEAGKLFVVAAGPEATLAAVRPLLDAMGQRTFEVGEDPVRANLIKLAGNFMIMSVVESLGEAMTLAARGGVEKATLLEVLTETLWGAPIYRNYGKLLVDGVYEPPGFALAGGLKDMNLVSQAATDARVPMPLLGIIRDHMLGTIARDGGAIDTAAFARAIEAAAGL